MSWDKNKAVAYARMHAYEHSHRKCELFVKQAIIAGGVSIRGTGSAKDMGTTLKAAGFHEVYNDPQTGDVAVIQAIPGHPDGHACIYDGHQWFSDFKQNTLYPGSEYRKFSPTYKLYRHN